MKKKIAIYLAGSIKKEHEKLDEAYWTDEDCNLLQTSLPHIEISFLNPALRNDNLSDQFSVFGRDMLQVFSSDVVLVDARDRRGLGVGAEMMWAKLHQIPVITWAPQGSHYYKKQTVLLGVTVSNWVHPFVESLSDQIVENMNEAAKAIDKLISGECAPIKDISYLESAMRYYCETNLNKDEPMKELIQGNEELQKRIFATLTP